MDAPETVTEAIRQLEADGYVSDFRLDATGIHCGACGGGHQPDRLVVAATARFEGITDPGDEEVVFAVVCPDCGARGIVVSGYGPASDPEVIDLLIRLTPRTS
jgi:hypothetical protein